MNNKSHYLENALIDTYLRNAPVAGSAAVYVGLFTVTPTKATAGTEVLGGNYARTVLSVGAPTNGAAANNAPCTFPTASASWGSIVGVAIFDDPTAGNMLYFGDLTTAKAIDTGDTASFAIGTLAVNET